VVTQEVKSRKHKSIAVIGGGPAGMIAAESLIASGYTVNLFDAKPAVLRKLLVAGNSGLNITKAESFDVFLSRYGEHSNKLARFLQGFGPEELISWVHGLGIQTFTGTSNKVFPEMMNAVFLRIAWIQRLQKKGVHFHLAHRWVGWNQSNELLFETRQGIRSFSTDATILALGGASWPTTGSDGKWLEVLEKEDLLIEPLKPANCGFNVEWSEHFRQKYAGTPIKSVILHFYPKEGTSVNQKGEFVISHYGVEGSLIYTFSSQIRDEISKFGQATIYLDLAPDWEQQKLESRLAKPRGSKSLSSHIYKSIGLRDAKAGLLWEFLSRESMDNPATLARFIKSLPVPLISPRPIQEAISTAGGLSFQELSDDLMLLKKPGVFCAGEMLDWEAPTGGYLLTACFSTGIAAAEGAKAWLEKNVTE